MIANWLACAVQLLTGVQARWIGCQPDATQRIYFANHTSHLDFLVLWSVLPSDARHKARPVAANDYWAKGRIRFFLANHVFRAILIERKKITCANNPMDQLVPLLQKGESLIMFPEGGRTTESEMQPFKGGLYHLTKAMPNVDLVPVFIDNANRVLPKGEFLPVPLICSVQFGAPIRLLPDESKEQFLIRAQLAVEALSKL